jgi:predicted N-acetyltransferase YhbS
MSESMDQIFTAKPGRTADLQFRQAEPADVDSLVRLINQAFLVERPFIEGDRTNVDHIRELFQKGQFLLAEEHSKLIGCVYLEQRGDRAYLGLLSVEPSRQGLGLGSRLTFWAEERARSIPVKAIDLSVVSGREGLADFYGKLGYRVIGTEPFAPGVPMKVPGHYIKMSKILVESPF